jgi:1-deoxy-D-xylulose-5-phosphate reductoisomerase
VRTAPDALCELAAHTEVDTVMAAIVGAAGLAPCLAAAAPASACCSPTRKRWSSAVALFMRAVREGGATAAADRQRALGDLQCLPDDRATWPTASTHIVLTASGGPFRGRDRRRWRESRPTRPARIRTG